MKRFMSLANIVIALGSAFLAFRILIMNGLDMNIMAVLLAIIVIGAMLWECALSPNRANFLTKTLVLIGAYFLVFFGLNAVLPKTSLSLDTLMYYSYFIYSLIGSFVVYVIGFFVLKEETEGDSANSSNAAEQAKLARSKYQQQLKQQRAKEKQAKKQQRKEHKARKQRKPKRKRTRKATKAGNTSTLQAKINADRANNQQAPAPQSQPQVNNQPTVNNSSDNEIL